MCEDWMSLYQHLKADEEVWQPIAKSFKETYRTGAPNLFLLRSFFINQKLITELIKTDIWSCW